MHTNRHPNYLSSWQSVLAQYPNIVVVLVNESEYFANSPLEKWYQKGEWRNSSYKNQHLSDYARILSLYKGGGMYMDLDFITLRPFSLQQKQNDYNQEKNIN